MQDSGAGRVIRIGEKGPIQKSQIILGYLDCALWAGEFVKWNVGLDEECKVRMEIIN